MNSLFSTHSLGTYSGQAGVQYAGNQTHPLNHNKRVE